MKLVVDGFGKSVAKRDNQIVIKENGKEVDYFRAEDVSQILLTGKGSITFDALTLLANHDIDCVSINWKGYVDYRLTPPEKKNVIVKKEQFFALADKRSGQIAKAFINAKIENQKAVLGTLAKSRSNDEFLTAQRDKLNYYLDKLDGLKKDTSDNLRISARISIVLTAAIPILIIILQVGFHTALLKQQNAKNRIILLPAVFWLQFFS